MRTTSGDLLLPRQKTRLVGKKAPPHEAGAVFSRARREPRVDVVQVHDDRHVGHCIGVDERIEMIEIEHIRTKARRFGGKGARDRGAAMSPEHHVGLASKRRRHDLDRLCQACAGLDRHEIHGDARGFERGAPGVVAAAGRHDEAHVEPLGQRPQQVERPEMTARIERPGHLAGDGDDGWASH